VTLTFLLTSLVIVATPGTGALYTLAAGLGRGARASVLAAFACTLGTVPHLVAAVTGLAALLHASGVAFAVLKYAGVAYLLWMAWSTWRDTGALGVPDGEATRVSRRRVLVEGITLNLLNPKLTIFFFAFLPQFVPAGSPGALPRMLLLSGVFMAMTFVVFALYGVAAAALRDRVLSRPRLVARIRKTFAATFAALGARLAVEGR
jgi:threonine/homoserine/homoserine lactone efflux protein